MKAVGLLRKLGHRSGRLVEWIVSFTAAGAQPGALTHPGGVTCNVTTELMDRVESL
jgi:hypothetical protein